MYLQSRRVRKWWRIRREYKYDPRFRAVIDAMANEFESILSPKHRKTRVLPER
jgi:hypothetical protein